MKVNSTELNILKLLFELVRDEEIQVNKVVVSTKKHLGYTSSYTYNMLSAMTTKGLIEKTGPRKSCYCKLTSLGLQCKDNTFVDKNGVHPDRRGECSCGKKGMIYWYKGEYLCRNCLNSTKSLRVEDFVYTSVDRFI